ncbi:stomatin-like protein, partial [Musa troglodytarum]
SLHRPRKIVKKLIENTKLLSSSFLASFFLYIIVPQRAINEAASDWGLKCLRYEIRDISPPPGVKAAMEMQAEAERRKRAQVLESEGERQAKINIADGTKASVILASEAAMIDQVNRAKGEAEAILARSRLRWPQDIVTGYESRGGTEAASLRIAEQYIKAFGCIAKEGTTLLLPSAVGNPSSMIAQALAIYKKLNVDNTSASLVENPHPETSEEIKSDGDSRIDQELLQIWHLFLIQVKEYSLSKVHQRD